MKHFIITVIVLAAFASCRTSQPSDSGAQMEVPITRPGAITSCPYLTKDNRGNLVLSWIQQDSSSAEGVMYYAVSTDNGRHFGRPMVIPATRGVHPHGENMPKMIFKKDGEIMAVFDVSAPSPGNEYTARMYYTHSDDGGKTWSPAAAVVTDPGSFDQRYFDLALLPDGNVGIIWLNNSEPQGSTLYYAVTDGEHGFSPGKIIGRHTCQCCRTDLLVDKKGDIHVAYRDIIQDSIRDMFYSVSTDTGKTFSKATRISPDNWVINACPHSGPDMAVNRSGLHFVWYTMGGGSGIYYCHSSDNGKTFSARESVSDNPSAKHDQIVALPDGKLVIVWDESVKNGDNYHYRIGLQERDPEGKVIKTAFITPDDEDAMFAALLPLNNDAVLTAYTTQKSDGKERVCYRRINLANFGD